MAYISVPQLPPSMFRENIGVIGLYCKSMLLKIYLVINSYLPIVISISNQNIYLIYWYLYFIPTAVVFLIIIPLTDYELRVTLYTNHEIVATL